ncbi:uncharacterized protein PV07_03877 [Cladophialophora immunda]|uniref:Uncharacterized protein n=1 Tax=Cladophialophora immunda TaxID=569365 RepID=A0A0D2CM65_9EURO|nr:uncharacterized protein PV07_03877 [Cladophialophora immunda]KIW32323.1 hypothetical protein PV07_03877 [Cladophialophora immunda]
MASNTVSGNQSRTIWEPSATKPMATVSKITVTSASSAPPRPIDQITDAYRRRYASYLASTFHISVEAANLEADYQLQPRRRSEASESEVYRV